MSCANCDGFLPPTGRACPHCGAPATGLAPTIGRALIAVVGGSAFSLTMMACYGGPPCETTGEDADGDGFVTAQGSTGGCFTQLDCNDDDATIHPEATDEFGDGLDQNCDGADGVITFCSVDEDCPPEQAVCNVDTARCEPAPAGEGEGEGEN